MNQQYYGQFPNPNQPVIMYNRRRSKVPVVLSVVFGVFLFLSLCYSFILTSWYTNLSASFKELTEKYRKLDAELSSYQKENPDKTEETPDFHDEQESNDETVIEEDPISPTSKGVTYDVQEASNGILVTATNNTSETIELHYIEVYFFDDDNNKLSKTNSNFYWLHPGESKTACALNMGSIPYTSYKIYDATKNMIWSAPRWENIEDIAFEPSEGNRNSLDDWGQIPFSVTNNGHSYTDTIDFCCAYYDEDDNLLYIEYLSVMGQLPVGETNNYLSFTEVPDDFDHFKIYLEGVMTY